MSYEQHNLTGCLTITLCDMQGRKVSEKRVNNLITTQGKRLVAEMFSGVVRKVPKIAIAVGEADVVATIVDTQLGKELDKVAATVSEPRVDEEGEVKVIAKVTALFPELEPDVEQQISEAGIVFDFIGSESVLYNRVTFAPVTRNANLQMTMTWEVTF